MFKRQRLQPMFDVMAKRGFFIDPPVPAPSGGGGSPLGQPSPAAGGPTPPGSQPPAPGNNQPPAGSFGPFKSADEVWKGYQELQKKFTGTSQELKALADWRSKVEQSLGGSKEDEFNVEDWLGQFATNPREAILKIVGPTLQSDRINNLKKEVNSNLDKLRNQYKDFADYEPQMQALVESGAFSSIDPVSLETLYHGIKSRAEFIKRAEEEAKKVRVPGVDGGPGAGGPQGTTLTEEQLRTMPFADLEKLARAAA